MTFSSFFKSRFATILLSVVLLLVCFIAIRILLEKHQIDSQIARLQAETDKIKKDNDQLSGLVGYLNTPDYTDKQAREQLNLKKDGEFVVALPADSGSPDPSATTAVSSQSNINKWFNYFFPN